MKAMIFGLGSIGTRHVRLLLDMGHEVIAFRSGKKGFKNTLGIPEVNSWNELDSWEVESALITNPTDQHIETALRCAEQNIPIFLEKPISASLENLDTLISLVEKHSVPTYVAYVLRFHPEVKSLKEKVRGRKIRRAKFMCRSYLPDWRPELNHLESYSASSIRGGGALLDVSHEFDLVSYIMGPIEKIEGRLEKRSNVTIDAEDFVEARVETRHGEAEVIIDIASKESERKIVIETESEILEANLLDGRDRDILYREQLEYFIDHRKDTRMMNNLCEASNLFRKLLSFREKSFAI